MKSHYLFLHSPESEDNMYEQMCAYGFVLLILAVRLWGHKVHSYKKFMPSKYCDVLVCVHNLLDANIETQMWKVLKFKIQQTNKRETIKS